MRGREAAGTHGDGEHRGEKTMGAPEIRESARAAGKGTEGGHVREDGAGVHAQAGHVCEHAQQDLHDWGGRERGWPARRASMRTYGGCCRRTRLRAGGKVGDQVCNAE